MSYQAIVDKIEIRTFEEKGKPRYIVNAVGAIANKKHIYEYSKKADGSFKTLKSMFTPHCIQSIKEQAKHRKLFVDTQHELVRDASIKSIVKGKISPDEEKQISNMLDRKKLPLAKVNDIDIEDDKLKIYTELNPMFREVDSDHQKYFDAVWYSLENQYLNGISMNFGDFKYDTDLNGDTVIDDVEILGFSYLDAPAEHANSIYEVAIRAMEEVINVREGVKMDEEKVKIEQERTKLSEERAKLELERVAIEKLKEESRQNEIKRQAEEHKKMQDEISAKTEQLKKLQEEKDIEMNRSKGIVGTHKPIDNKSYDSQFFKENLKEITSEHDNVVELRRQGKTPLVGETMSGFAKLVNLQAKINPTAGLDEEYVQEINKGRLLDRAKADIITPRSGREF